MSSADFEVWMMGIDGEDDFVAIVVDAPGELSRKLPIFQKVFRISTADLKESSPDLSHVVKSRDPLLRFPQSLTGQKVEKFGIASFEQLFWRHNKLRETWEIFLGKEKRRLKLCMTEEAGAWPWEALYDNQKLNGFLARRNISIVRYVKMVPLVEPLPVDEEPLRMLVVFADPKGDLSKASMDEGKSYIEMEIEAITQALEPLTRSRDLIIDWIKPDQEGRGKTTLQRIAMEVVDRKRRYHILHYFGHGSSNRQGLLHLESGEGGQNATFKVNWGDLSPSLADTLQSLRLVVLNACELAQPDIEASGHTPFTNLATSFLHAGVAIVVAMQYPIRKETAPQFTEAFYQYLCPHLFTSAIKVEEAVLKARARIANSPNSVEWITPVVFTRMADDVIFKVPEDRLRKYREKRRVQEDINKLLREVEDDAKAKHWVEAAKKVKEILQKDPASEEGKLLREKLIKKAIEMVKNLDPIGKEIHRLLKDL